MKDLDRLLIERECERLVVKYCHYVDHGEAARIADLFTEDGVWHSAEATMSGVEEIRKGFGQRQANAARMSRHVCNNLLVDVEDENHARGCVYLTLYRHDGEPDRKYSPLVGPVIVGEYRDAFVRTSQGWRIQRREVFVNFIAKNS